MPAMSIDDQRIVHFWVSHDATNIPREPSMTEVKRGALVGGALVGEPLLGERSWEGHLRHDNLLPGPRSHPHLLSRLWNRRHVRLQPNHLMNPIYSPDHHQCRRHCYYFLVLNTTAGRHRTRMCRKCILSSDSVRTIGKVAACFRPCTFYGLFQSISAWI